jgi:hypothetical protein
VSEKFKEICSSSSEKVKCYNFVMKEVVGIKSKVEALCKDKLYLSISQYCAEPLKTCPPSPPQAVTEEDLKYCFTKIVQQQGQRGGGLQLAPGAGSTTTTSITYYHLRIVESSACSRCNERDTTCQETNCICKGNCKKIYDNLNSIWERCCMTEGGLTSRKIEIGRNELRNACSYFTDNITACCKDYVILAVDYCGHSPFIGDFGSRSLEAAIENNIGKFYLEYVKKRMKDFRKLWENKDNCY